MTNKNDVPMKKHRLFTTLLFSALTMQVTLAQEIRIVGQNVQNFFYSLDRTRTQNNSTAISNYTTVEGRTAKLNAIVTALYPYEADIYAFNEVECCEEVMQLLAQRMGELTGKTYDYVKDGLTYDHDDSQNAAGIVKSGFIYNTATISLNGSSYSGSGTNFIYSRQNRFQSFESVTSGERFTLSMNHFKSGSADTDKQSRATNASNLLSALTGATDPDILVIGDLNGVVGETALNTIQDAGYAEQLLKYIDSHSGKYTHCWDGGEIIDHVYANSLMAEQVTDAEILPIANSCSLADETKAYSDHNPYLITLTLKQDPTYSFKKATTVTAGKQYLMAANLSGGLKIATPLAMNIEYGYLYTQTATVQDDIITIEKMSNAFTLESAGSDKFYIKDSNDRYFYQQTRSGGGYYTTVAATADKNTAHKFTVTLQDDGTFKMLSETGYYIYGTVYQQTTPEFCFTNYATLYSPNCLPWLYEYDPTITAITEVPVYSRPTTTIKTVEQGRLVIKTSNGSRYNLQGIQIR